MTAFFNDHPRVVAIIAFLVFWLFFFVCFYVVMGPVENRWLFSLSGFPLLSILTIVFLGAWWFLFDFLPPYVVQKVLGPPWRRPRPMEPFNQTKLTAQYYRGLLQRLDVVSENIQDRTIHYQDRYTNQEWIGQYTERGFGGGYSLRPIKTADIT